MRQLIMGILLTFLTFAAIAQRSEIRGSVKSVDGEPLPSAVVVIENTNMGALTDEEGGYRISIEQAGIYVLVVSFPGFQSLKEEVKIKTGEVVIKDFALREDEVIIGPPMIEPIPILRLISLAEASVFEDGSAPENGVFANSDVTPSEIAPLNNGQDMPQLLRFTPSMVTTSDAGAGIGYTSMRIRGSDQSRINVTINGIPYNDPESQGVFWVNMPDFASSADDISIQRGVGSSTNGAGAFGGTIGVRTDRMAPQAFGEITNGYGSFNTWRHTVKFGSGVLENGFGIEGRVSQITSDGYIDRASSDLRSYFLNGQYTKGRLNIKALVFGGKERTYQSWWGVPEVALEGTPDDIREWGLNNGYTDQQIEDLLTIGRRANYYTYENEVDDYAQDHYQLHLAYEITPGLTFRAAGHYTYGRGFFEQYREDDQLSDYGIDNIILDAVQQFSDEFDVDGNPVNSEFEANYMWDQVEFLHSIVTDVNGDPITNGSGDVLLNSLAQITRSDVIRRRWLENDFYGATWSLDFFRMFDNDRLSVVYGGAYNEYDGDHFGELIWMQHPNTSAYGDLYYFNNGFKTDFNNYFKVNYLLNRKLNVFGDLQYRQVQYEVRGTDADLTQIAVSDSLSFLNPKFGLGYYINPSNMFYASYAIGNREPTRNDYVDAPDGRSPRHERMADLEFGYRGVRKSMTYSINVYNMDYADQLVLTGELNDVGTPIRTNVAESYRRGVELELSVQIGKALSLGANSTYSQNKINRFTEEVASYDDAFNFIGFAENDLGETDISFSPELISAAWINYRFERLPHRLDLGWQVKYVSDQFLDNTSNADRMIPAYLVNDARVTYTLLNKGMKELRINVLLNNVLDERYVSNGYTYGYLFDGQRYDEDFFYPQAGRNFLVGLTLAF